MDIKNHHPITIKLSTDRDVSIPLFLENNGTSFNFTETVETYQGFGGDFVNGDGFNNNNSQVMINYTFEMVNPLEVFPYVEVPQKTLMLWSPKKRCKF